MGEQEDRKLDTPATRTGGGATGEPLASAQSLGRYQILSVAGTGGMGRVYAAFDPQLDRRVALKVVHVSSGEAHRQRAAREAKALARVSHPNVVAIHEVNEHDGQLLIAMEFVRGQTLKLWMRENPPCTRQDWVVSALEVLLQAGRGLAAAHEVQLVHRDFKPSNVLVGDDGRVRVVDFGLARDVLSRPRVEATSDSSEPASREQITETGTVVGTPAYMAPEQAEGRALDGRTDQYGFCVTAWEVLYGLRPEGGEVERNRESVVPIGVEKALRKGLSRKPSARFEELAGLLERLEGERDALVGERRRRGTRMLAVGVGGGAVLVAAFGIRHVLRTRTVNSCIANTSVVAETWNPETRGAIAKELDATRLGARAPIGDKTTERLDAYVESWRDAMAQACTRTFVDEAWEPDELDDVVWCLEGRRSSFESVVGALRTVDETVALNAIDAAANLPLVSECLDVTRLPPSPPAGVDKSRLDGAQQLLAEAESHMALGRYADAKLDAERAVSAAQEVEWVPLLARARLVLARSLLKEETDDAALGHARAALLESTRSQAWKTGASAAVLIGNMVGTNGEVGEGLFFIEMASTLSDLAGDASGLLGAEIKSAESSVLRAAGESDASLDAAERATVQFEHALGAGHPRTSLARRGITRAHRQKGEFDKAIALAKEIVAEQSKSLGPQHPEVAETYGYIGLFYREKGHGSEAKKYFEKAIGILEPTLGSEHSRTAVQYGDLGGVYGQLGDWDRALEYAKKAAQSHQRQHGDTPAALGALVQLAEAYDRNDLAEDAVAIHERVVRILDRGGVEPRRAVIALVGVGRFNDRKNRFKKAEQFFRRALRLAVTELGDQHPDVAYVEANIAITLIRQERFSEALVHAESAVDLSRRTSTDSGMLAAHFIENLGRAHRGMGNAREAFDAWEEAYELRAAELGPDHAIAKRTLELIRELCTVDDYAPACDSGSP